MGAKHSNIKVLYFCFYLFEYMPFYSSKRLVYIHRPTKKLIIKLKIVVYVAIYKKWMLWSYFPGLAMFEFINQYHFFFSLSKLFLLPTPIGKLDFKDLSLLLGVNAKPILYDINAYQPVDMYQYQHINTYQLHINHVLEYIPNVLQLQLSRELIYTVGESKWYPFINR